MDNLQSMKGKALLKDSIVRLLDMISKHEVITSRSTNATNNKLKDEAWNSIAQEFCAVTGDFRHPKQLRLKWENLKKSARKRSALIRQNNLKTGGGKIFIPPDDVLDRVASILGATCTGFSVEFGGDRVNETDVELVPPGAIVEVLDCQPLPELPETAQSSSVVVSAGGDCVLNTDSESIKNFIPKKLTKKRKLSEEVQSAQRDKDLGLAAYFRTKVEKAGIENKKSELENSKIELEVKKLELENIKLELEIRLLKEKNMNCE
ncbi:uncharacterized protein [Epargyreus clarus]|uniref:uncharacterized protein isoform X2 n=1 Tax=Epargyreus clarus TaxID=520877 RepID=UPI003C2E1499